MITLTPHAPHSISTGSTIKVKSKISSKALLNSVLLSRISIGIALILLLCVARSINAHEIKPAIVDLNYIKQGPQLELEIKMLVNLEALISDIGPSHEDTKDANNSDAYDALRAMNEKELLFEFDSFKPRLINGITLLDNNNITQSMSVDSVNIPPIGNLEIARDTTIILRSTLNENVNALSWQWEARFGETIVRANSNIQSMDYAALLSPGQRSDLIHFTDTVQVSAWRVIANYIVVGFEHILPKGLDHILFVIGLFLLTTRWRVLAIQVTTFTLAHSITLALGVSKVLVIAPEIVEPLIALSIVFVCVENLFASNLSRWRVVMVFLFGLLHGLGFASVLEAVGLDSSNFVIALLGFNVGVELGQLFVVAICMLLVGIWFGKHAHYAKWFSKPASVVVGLVGLYWFAERILPYI